MSHDNGVTTVISHMTGLEGGAMSFDLNHEVVDVDELSSDGQALERRLR